MLLSILLFLNRRLHKMPTCSHSGETNLGERRSVRWPLQGRASARTGTYHSNVFVRRVQRVKRWRAHTSESSRLFWRATHELLPLPEQQSPTVSPPMFSFRDLRRERSRNWCARGVCTRLHVIYGRVQAYRGHFLALARRVAKPHMLLSGAQCIPRIVVEDTED